MNIYLHIYIDIYTLYTYDLQIGYISYTSDLHIICQTSIVFNT